MGLNETVSAERIHIGFFGLRNAGKSSVVNAFTGQDLALVSDVKGTTTDPVKKAMELLPLGPVVIVDTPGMDDEGELGKMRVQKARQALNYTDIAILVVDAQRGKTPLDEELIAQFELRKIPYLVALNKCDLVQDTVAGEKEVCVSALTKMGIETLKEKTACLMKTEEEGKKLVADLLSPGDRVVLVMPIDSAAPKGRLILPQQQTIRDILDAGAMALVTKETELPQALTALSEPPKIVITDSQAFGRVSKDTPEEILLTSFSILFARYKGDLAAAARGAGKLDRLQDGDTVLISEGCTHHRQCGDIGTQKLPNWILKHTGKDIRFEFTSGTQFPEDVSRYALVIHCGGCMLTPREMTYRQRQTQDCGVEITNYGIAIAHMHGILRRSLQPFPEALKALDGE